jgi:hypothetical protein
MSQLLSESLKRLAFLAAKVPSNRRDGSVGASCLWRWATRGVRTKGGGVVRLETVTVAGRLMSSEPALERFIAAQQSVGAAIEPPLPARGVGKRETACQKAAEALAEIGI